jgi:hypothetical protein
MKTEIVVARYNEDLSWLKKIPKSIKIIVYNKGLDNIDFPSIKLPNIGRESHTYLYHIIQNYNNLSDQTIFCQGDSIFHSPDFLNLIKNRKLFQPIQPLSAFYWPEGIPPKYFSNPPIPLLNATKNLWIKSNKIHVEYMDNEFRTVYPYYYQEDYFVRLVDYIKKTYNVVNVLKFNIDRFNLKNINLNELFPVCYAGLFAVNKDVIKENSISFYNNIMSVLLYDIKYLNNSVTIFDHGLFLEKLWLLIFNYKKNNKNYIKLKVKDFPIFDKYLIIKNNNIHFKLFIITCQIFIEIYIDNKYYKLYLSRDKISLKNNKNIKLVHNFVRLNKKIQNILKDMTNLDINITLNNNILIVIVNKFKLINYNFNYNVNKITNAKILSLSKENKFQNIL